MDRTAVFFAVISFLAAGGGSACAVPQDERHIPTINEKKISEIFTKADSNHDGVLTREEAEKTPVLHSHFNDMDVNQDGQVTRHEMIASMRGKKRHHGRNAVNLYR